MKTAAKNRADIVFRAFSDRTRLRILSLLRASADAGVPEVGVGDLIAVLGVPQAKVSRHLAALREAGLVEVEKEGKWRYYRLAEAKGELHGKLLECLVCCFGEVPELKKDAKKLGVTVHACSAGGCSCCG